VCAAPCWVAHFYVTALGYRLIGTHPAPFLWWHGICLTNSRGDDHDVLQRYPSRDNGDHFLWAVPVLIASRSALPVVPSGGSVPGWPLCPAMATCQGIAVRPARAVVLATNVLCFIGSFPLRANAAVCPHCCSRFSIKKGAGRLLLSGDCPLRPQSSALPCSPSRWPGVIFSLRQCRGQTIPYGAASYAPPDVCQYPCQSVSGRFSHDGLRQLGLRSDLLVCWSTDG
jgi:hypothetical protein